jgi:hypothetical protein
MLREHVFLHGFVCAMRRILYQREAKGFVLFGLPSWQEELGLVGQHCLTQHDFS